MPTYEYHCPKCKKKFDHFQGIKDEPLAKCPHCKKGKPERLISGGTGLIFKGSGFYITDYKKKTGEPKGEPKKESKPEIPAPTKTTKSDSK